MITYISSTLPNHTYYAFRGCSNDLQRHFIITRCKASEKTRDVDYHQQMHQEIYWIRIFIFSSFSAFSEHSHCLKYVNVLLNETFSVIFKHCRVEREKKNIAQVLYFIDRLYSLRIQDPLFLMKQCNQSNETCDICNNMFSHNT